MIVSERCGCAPELVGDNGFTFDPLNEDELTARLLDMTSLSDDERRRLEDASYRIAANVAPERFGEALEQAAQLVRSDSRKTSLLSRMLIKSL